MRRNRLAMTFASGVLEVNMEPKNTQGRTPTQDDASCQAYFWSDRWQQGEREASDDIKAGRVTTFESAAAFLESIDD